MDEIRDGFVRPGWSASARVRACVTTRLGGCSAPPFDSLNVSTAVGDDDADVARNRRRLHERLRLPGGPLWLEQEHGVRVAVVERVLEQADELSPAACRADAAVSFEAGRVCAVTTADCLPVLFCDRAASRVGAAHAGWRGLAGGVLEAAVARLGCPPAELLAWLGPAIGPHAFRVGDEVRERFLREDEGCALAFLPDNTGAWLADLYQLARRRLQRLGVREITGGYHCTYTDDKHFFSHRRDRRTGRMAALIWLARDGAT